MVRLVLAVEEGLLREVVAAAEAGLGIDSRELGVGHGGEEGEDQREGDPRPDVARHRAAIRRRGGGLKLIGDPEERAWRDQRHGVHGDAGEPERRLDGRSFLRHTPSFSPGTEGATDMPRRPGRSAPQGGRSWLPATVRLLVLWAEAQKTSRGRTSPATTGAQSLRRPVAISSRTAGGSGT